MSRFRKIHVSMYADQKFRDLSYPAGKYLWIYLLTGPHTTNIPGLSTIGENALAESLDWELKDLRKAFLEVLSKGIVQVDWKARVVWIPNAAKYNSPESPNVIKGWSKTWKEIPECALKVTAYKALKDFAKGLPKGFAEAFNKTFAHPSANQEQEQEQEQEPKSLSAVADVIDSGTIDPPKERGKVADPAKVTKKPRRKDDSAKPEHSEVVRFFQERWKVRYRIDYSWKIQDGQHVKWILNKLGRDANKAKAIIKAYLGDDDRWTVEQAHPVGILVSRFDAYRLKAEGGGSIDRDPDRELNELTPEQDALTDEVGAQILKERANGRA